MTVSTEFWESLGISIDDIVDKETEMKEGICRRLAHKLEKLSEDYFQLVKDTFKTSGDSFPEILQSLYSSSRDEFIELFALAEFAEKKINPEIIYEVASGKLTGGIARRNSEKTVDSVAVLLPLLKSNPESIRKIYYDYLTQRSAMKKFISEPRLSNPLTLSRFSSKKIESLLQEFERTRRAKQKRPVKLWWFDNDDEKGRVVFRREKNARSQLKLVGRNVFHKTGDEKIFIFREHGNVLEMCSRREPKLTVKIAEFILRKLTRQNVKYVEVINHYDSAKVDEFINRLKLDEIENAKLLSVRIRNAPLVNSPMVELQCSECLVPTIKDLEENHNLSLITRSADILSLRIQFDGRAYNLKTRVEGNEIEFISDNKNLRDLDKQKISQFLTEQISK